MIEVEAKVRVSDLKGVRKKISKIGKFIGKEKKVDDYYTLESLNKYPKKSLRIRKSKGFHVINFKRRISYERGVHAKHETEFKVTDIKGFLDLIDDFGFKKWLRKEKTTYLYGIGKKLNIELNEVGGLGWFLEVECLTEKDIRKARKEVLGILKRLGISKKGIVKEGYTKMLWDLKK
jgi:adenylate cyclase class 2